MGSGLALFLILLAGGGFAIGSLKKHEPKEKPARVIGEEDKAPKIMVPTMFGEGYTFLFQEEWKTFAIKKVPQKVKDRGRVPENLLPSEDEAVFIADKIIGNGNIQIHTVSQTVVWRDRFEGGGDAKGAGVKPLFNQKYQPTHYVRRVE